MFSFFFIIHRSTVYSFFFLVFSELFEVINWKCDNNWWQNMFWAQNDFECVIVSRAKQLSNDHLKLTFLLCVCIVFVALSRKSNDSTSSYKAVTNLISSLGTTAALVKWLFANELVVHQEICSAIDSIQKQGNHQTIYICISSTLFWSERQSNAFHVGAFVFCWLCISCIADSLGRVSDDLMLTFNLLLNGKHASHVQKINDAMETLAHRLNMSLNPFDDYALVNQFVGNIKNQLPLDGIISTHRCSVRKKNDPQSPHRQPFVFSFIFCLFWFLVWQKEITIS